jgi:hypothetical protein
MLGSGGWRRRMLEAVFDRTLNPTIRRPGEVTDRNRAGIMKRDAAPTPAQLSQRRGYAAPLPGSRGAVQALLLQDEAR